MVKYRQLHLVKSNIIQVLCKKQRRHINYQRVYQVHTSRERQICNPGPLNVKPNAIFTALWLSLVMIGLSEDETEKATEQYFQYTLCLLFHL